MFLKWKQKWKGLLKLKEQMYKIDKIRLHAGIASQK